MTGSRGGGKLPPPLIVIKIYNIWYIFKKKKNGKFANIQISKFLLQYLVIKQKLCSKTAQISTNNNFWKAFDPENLNLEKHLKNFEIYMFIQDKLKIWKFLCKNMCKIDLQKFCNLAAFVISFPKSCTVLKSYDWK